MIFVQEPWTKTINLKNATKSHPAYVTFTPPNRDWKNARPRALTYVRKKSNLRSVQLDSCHKRYVDNVGKERGQEVVVRLKVAILHDTRDRCISTRLKGQTRIIEHYDLAISICVLYSRGFSDNSGLSPNIIALRLQSSPLIEIINVYRQPQAPILESLCTLLQWPVKPNTIIVGDFNLHYKLWEPNVSRSSGVSTLIEWIDVHSLRSAVTYGAPTHRAGHVLDLVLSTLR